MWGHRPKPKTGADKGQTPRDWTSEDATFRRLVENVPDYAIFLLDSTGHVLTWNLGARRIKGYEADEIVGRHFSVF